MYATSLPWRGGRPQQQFRGFQHFLGYCQDVSPQGIIQASLRRGRIVVRVLGAALLDASSRSLLGILPMGTAGRSECEPHHLRDSLFYLGLDCRESLLYS